jgi:hypothetical protein
MDNIHTKENDNVRLFNELLPWTFNCRTLIDAARNGQTDKCEQLIRLGVDINECDNYGNTALWTSYFHEHLDTLFTLLQVVFHLDCFYRFLFCCYCHSLVLILIHVQVIFYVQIFIVHVHLVIEH